MKDWVNTAIFITLRAGVLISIAIIIVGATITFVHHPDYFSSRPALGELTSPKAHFPNTLADVFTGVRDVRGQAIIALGLIVLIATPVARVVMSVFIFLVEHDWLYTAITTAVVIILFISFSIGLVE